MRATRPTTLAPNGMVATSHYLASGAGLKVLEDGGSAMDAVIAANAALTVLYPDQTSIGGDCFFLVFDSHTGEVTSYNGSGPAPDDADADLLRAQGYSSIPRYSPLCVTVPGTIDAWVAGHERYGRLDFDRLLQPAIGFARDGFPVSPRLAAAIRAEAETLVTLPGLAETMLPGGAPPTDGDRLRWPALAASLQSIANRGRDAFYEGDIADAIARTIAAGGGWLDQDDLADFQGEWVEPLRAAYRGTTVLGCPPNSQGITALLGLKMVEHEDLGSTWGAARHVHPLVEAKKRSFTVRNERIADPRFVDIDTDALLDPDFINELWADYSPDAASASLPSMPGDTVYLCAVDRDGNAVSMIQSIYQSFGSGVVAEGTGIILQSRGTAFSLTASHPNELEPGKRPRHTLMPSMLLRDDRLLGPIGTQGGDAQAQVHIQLITNLIDFGMEPQAAIEAPRWISSGSAPLQLVMEVGFPEGTVQSLATRGHEITLIDPWNPNAGHAQMILVDEERGMLRGGADPRADGAALGY